MPARPLTARFVESVKPTPGKQAAYPDANVRGLELRVSPEGRKVWSLRYRTNAGLQRRMTLGTMPSMDLEKARSSAKMELGKVAAGDDPAALKRAEAARARSEPIKTFADLAEAYFKACERGEWKPRGKRKRPQTITHERGIYRRHLQGSLGDLRLEDIDRAAVKGALRKLVDAGIGAQTNRTQALARQCFAFAIHDERLAINPATGFAPLATQAPKTRTLRDAELKALWNALLNPAAFKREDGKPISLSRPMAIVLQLMALLLQRRVEVAGMRASELNLEQATWLIPAERMKAGVAHLVPLPPKAVELIQEAVRRAREREEARPASARVKLERRSDGPIFPGARDLARPIHPDSVTHAFASLAAAVGLDGVSPHDLRRTGSTALTSERLGVSPFIRSKVLGHRTDPGGGAAVSMVHYDANEYVAEKRRALEAWEGLLLEIASNVERPTNVSRLRG